MRINWIDNVNSVVI